MAQTANRTIEKADRRAAARLVLGRPGTIRFDTGEAIEVTVIDLNRDGCRILTDAAITPGAEFSIGLAHVGHSRARVVWRGQNGYGCDFLRSLSPGSVTAAFEASNVAHFPIGKPPISTLRPKKWSPRSRLIFLFGTTAASWLTLGFAALLFV